MAQSSESKPNCGQQTVSQDHWNDGDALAGQSPTRNLDPSPSQALESAFSAQGVRQQMVEMQQRCRKLLDEVEAFQLHLKDQRKEKLVELRAFKGGIHAEMKLLDKLQIADPCSPKTSHALRSSNLSFFTAVWDTAKGCRGIMAFSKRFYWHPKQRVSYINGKVSTKGTTHRKYSAVVDIVAQDGQEWIKVSSITEKRVIWDLAKAGWVGDSSDEASESGIDDEGKDDDPEGIFRQAEALMKASLATRVKYRHPKVRLVLSRIKAVPDSKEVCRVLQKIKNLGVTIQTSEELLLEVPCVSQVLDSMIADRFHSFSLSLNIDCTILLAFASDLSHGRVEPEYWHNKAVSRQIEAEIDDQLLPNSLWPACSNRKLVCTREAAVRMQEIVAIIGTETERKRANLMLNLDDTSLTSERRLQIFQGLSDYLVPSDWLLPIEIMDVDVTTLKPKLPTIAESLAEKLTSINRSVFFYGWAMGFTTLSSNCAVAKQIEATIEESRSDEETKGPDVWLCPTSRSLVGKEKQRRGF